MTTESAGLRYLSVVLSSKGIAEMDDESRAVFIPRQDIQRIELSTGSGAERPVAQAVAAGVLIILGMVGIKWIWSGFHEGVSIKGKLSMAPFGLVAFMGVGIWLLWDVLRSRTFLLVTTKDDTRKIVFYGKVDPVILQEFLRDGQQELGHVIHSRSGHATEVI